MRQVRVIVSGRVQGVGFRYWTEVEALRRGLQGWVRNRREGSVEAVFKGDEALVEDMLRACREGPPLARVTDVDVQEHDSSVEGSFRLLPTV